MGERKGKWKLFSMDVADEKAQIRVTAFNDVVDKFFNKIENGKTYYIANAYLKNANAKFSTIKNNFEMTLTSDTLILECNDLCDKNIFICENEFKNISEIKNLTANTIFNVIGICFEIRGLENITAKESGKQYKKRDVIIIDTTNETIAVTLWNEQAENFSEENLRSVLTFTNVRINEYNTKKSITLIRDSAIKYDQNTPIAKSMKMWFESKNNKLIEETIKKNEMNGVNWMSIESVFEHLPSSTVNTFGICLDVGNLIVYTQKKTGIELKKRLITIIDQSKKPLIVKLWNLEANDFHIK